MLNNISHFTLFRSNKSFLCFYGSVRNWAEKLGGELWHFGELVTRKKMVIDVRPIQYPLST